MPSQTRVCAPYAQRRPFRSRSLLSCAITTQEVRLCFQPATVSQCNKVMEEHSIALKHCLLSRARHNAGHLLRTRLRIRSRQRIDGDHARERHKASKVHTPSREHSGTYVKLGIFAASRIAIRGVDTLQAWNVGTASYSAIV
jgi:hypothetical protein